VTVLGIETATSVCGVALVNGQKVVAERWIDERYAHAERLFGFLDHVLEEGRTKLADVDCIAVSIGPGSFTGLRIGLSMVKGLHMATGIPVIAIPTLLALARASIHAARASGVRYLLTALDARREEVYWQMFAVNPDDIRPLNDVQDIRIAQLPQAVPVGKVAITGEARREVADMLVRQGREASQVFLIPDAEARCSAVEVARCGAGLFAAGTVADVSSLEPQYIKEFFLRNPG
jgi:tRNA threonylcarbamoyladenosine biosynthesis protein TsaB